MPVKIFRQKFILTALHFDRLAFSAAGIKVNSKNEINNIIFTFDNYKNVIIVLNRLKGILPDTDIAIRVTRLKNAEIFAERLREYYHNITLFGEDSQVLGKSFVLENETKQKAIDFNYNYNITAAKIMGYELPEDSAVTMWERLNTVKKESSQIGRAHV